MHKVHLKKKGLMSFKIVCVCHKHNFKISRITVLNVGKSCNFSDFNALFVKICCFTF